MISGLMKSWGFFLGLGRIKNMRREMPTWGAARPTPTGFLAASKTFCMWEMMSNTFLSSVVTDLATWRRTGSGTVTMSDMSLF